MLSLTMLSGVLILMPIGSKVLECDCVHLIREFIKQIEI